MIEVRNLRKVYGPVVAVDDVSFSVAPGEILGLLGPNGAGKTTTMRMLTGLIDRTSGSILFDGKDISQQLDIMRASLGSLPDGAGLYPRLTARENIQYFGTLYGVPEASLQRRIDDLVDLLHMGSIIDRRVTGFSHGERTKVALARALIHDPRIILLDEPTNGLDVLTTRAVRKLLLTLKQENKIIIFSSHLMHEVDHLCDRAVVVANGKVSASGTLDELKSTTSTATFEDAFVKLAYSGEDE